MEKKLLFWAAAFGTALYLGYKFLFKPKAQNEPPTGEKTSPDPDPELDEKAIPDPESDEKVRPELESDEKTIFNKIDILNLSKQSVEIEQFDMKFMVGWFKTEILKHKEALANKNTKAIVLIPEAILGKDWNKTNITRVDSQRNYFIQGIFDTQKEEFITVALVNAKVVSKEVTEIFGGKSILILK